MMIYKTVTILVIVAVLFLALYVMLNKMGILEQYDFGAGAYYYADIPNYQSLDGDGAFESHIPRWIHIVLFLAWGWLMYMLWKWIEKH